MSGFIRREDRLFDPTTGALVGYIDAKGNEVLGSLPPAPIIVSTSAPVDADGRPDGTIWIKV